MLLRRFLLDSCKLSTSGLPIHFGLLEKYKSWHGNLLIPKKYVVERTAEQTWDAEAVGFKLGLHVQNIRQKYKKNSLSEDLKVKLNDMKFIPDVLAETNRVQLLAFAAFKEKFNKCTMPILYEVPTDDESWPEEVRGLKLGGLLCRIRKSHPKDYRFIRIRQDLLDLGYDLSLMKAAPNFELFFRALQVYKGIHGSVVIPDKYCTGQDERYEPQARGIALGRWLASIRREGCFAEHRGRLMELGVVFAVKKLFKVDDVCRAMVVFKELHGHTNVTRGFVVPQDDAKWPKELWGLNLGRRLAEGKVSKRSELRERLKGMGVELTDTDR